MRYICKKTGYSPVKTLLNRKKFKKFIAITTTMRLNEYLGEPTERIKDYNPFIITAERTKTLADRLVVTFIQLYTLLYTTFAPALKKYKEIGYNYQPEFELSFGEDFRKRNIKGSIKLVKNSIIIDTLYHGGNSDLLGILNSQNSKWQIKQVLISKEATLQNNKYPASIEECIELAKRIKTDNDASYYTILNGTKNIIDVLPRFCMVLANITWLSAKSLSEQTDNDMPHLEEILEKMNQISTDLTDLNKIIEKYFLQK